MIKKLISLYARWRLQFLKRKRARLFTELKKVVREIEEAERGKG